MDAEMETSCSCNTNDFVLSKEPTCVHLHEHNRKCDSEPNSTRERIGLNPEPMCGEVTIHPCPHTEDADCSCTQENRSTINLLVSDSERSADQHAIRERKKDNKIFDSEKYLQVMSNYRHHKHSVNSPSLSHGLLRFLFTVLFIGTLSSLAYASSGNSLHTSSSQNVAQQNVKEIFMFGGDNWKVEELDSELKNSLQSSVEPKLTLNLQHSVAFIGHLFQSEILSAGYETDAEDVMVYYTASEAGRNSLPSWLHLDDFTGQLTGIPLQTNAGKLYLSVNALISNSDTSNHHTVNEVFLITVLDTTKSSPSKTVAQSYSSALGRTSDGRFPDCTSRYTSYTPCPSNDSAVVANLVLLKDFNSLRPQHRANLYRSVASLVGVCPEDVWLRSIDWSSPEGMRLWSQLADATFKELLHHATILSFQIDCVNASTSDAAYRELEMNVIKHLNSALMICSDGLILDDDGYVNVDCYQLFVTRGSFLVIHQMKVTSEEDHTPHKLRLKRQEVTDDDFEFNNQIPPISIPQSSSQSSSTNTVPVATTTDDTVSSLVGTMIQPSVSSVQLSLESGLVPSSDELTLLHSQSATISVRTTSSTASRLSTTRDLFNVVTTMPQFVMSSFIILESVTTVMQMVITPTPSRSFTFSIPTSIEDIESTSMFGTSSSFASVSITSLPSTSILSTSQRSDFPVSTSPVSTVELTSFVTATSSMIFPFSSQSSPSSVSATMVSITRLLSPSAASLSSSSSMAVTTPQDSSSSSSPTTLVVTPSPSLLTTFLTLSRSIPTSSEQQTTISETSFPVLEPSSSISFFFMSSDVDFTVVPTTTSSLMASSSRSVSLLMPMSSSELTLSISIFSPSAFTSIPISMTVFSPDVPSSTSVSEIIIEPTSTVLVATSIGPSITMSLPASSSSLRTTSQVSSSFSDLFEISSTPIFLFTTITSFAPDSTTIVSSSTSSLIFSSSPSLLTATDFMTFVPEPTTTVVLLTPDDVVSTPISPHLTSSFELPLTTTPFVLEPSSLADTPSLSLPISTPTLMSSTPTMAFSTPLPSPSIPSSSIPLPSTSIPIPSTSIPIPSTSISIPSTSIPIPSTSIPIPSTSIPISSFSTTSSLTLSSILTTLPSSSRSMSSSPTTSLSESQSTLVTETLIFPSVTTDLLFPFTSTFTLPEMTTITFPSMSSIISSSTSTTVFSSPPPPSPVSPSTVSAIPSPSIPPSPVSPSTVSAIPSLSIPLTVTTTEVVVISSTAVSVNPSPTPNMSLCGSVNCGNGSCVDLNGDFLCECYAGWTGQFCGVDIDYCIGNSNETLSDPCDPIGAVFCVDGNSTFTCTCTSGYTGRTCSDDINECDSSPCLNNATCNNLIDAFSCTCPTGFTGSVCEVETDPCVPDPCKDEEVCINLGDNSFDCIPVIITSDVMSSSTPVVSVVTPTPSSTKDIRSTSVFMPTFTTSSASVLAPTPTPIPLNMSPYVLNPLGILLTNEGQLFQVVVPENTFYDAESGSTYQLRLSLYDVRGSPLPNTTWVQLRYLPGNVPVIEGIPLRNQVLLGSITDHVFLLRAEDAMGGITHDIVTIRVIPPATPIENFLVVLFEGQFDLFNQNLTAKVELFQALASFGSSNSNEVYIDSFSSGSIAVLYHNLSIPGSSCVDFRAWANTVFLNGSYTDKYVSLVSPFVPLGELQIKGPCNSSDTNPTSITTPSTVGLVRPDRDGDRVLLYATVIPAVFVALLCLVAAIMALVLYRRKRSERVYLYDTGMRRTFLNRRPVILAGEADFPARSRRPVVLTNDLAVRDEDEIEDLGNRRTPVEEVDYDSQGSDDDDEEIMTALIDRRTPVHNELPPEYILPPLYSYARFRFS